MRLLKRANLAAHKAWLIAAGRPSIGLALFGCINRPYYRIVVFPDRCTGRRHEGNIIEQVGSFDPIPNWRNEKLVALNFTRIKYYIAVHDAHVSTTVLDLFGLAGFYPLHPKTFIRARHARAFDADEANRLKKKVSTDDELKEEKDINQLQTTSLDSLSATGQ